MAVSVDFVRGCKAFHDVSGEGLGFSLLEVVVWLSRKFQDVVADGADKVICISSGGQVARFVTPLLICSLERELC